MNVEQTSDYRGGDGEETLSPQNNSELFGHEKAEATLYAAWKSCHLHHAWLISGPEGIGKATLAHRFARFLLSPRNVDGAEDDGNGSNGNAGDGDLFADDSECVPPEELRGELFTNPGSRIFQRVSAGGHADLLTVTRSIDPKTKKLRGEIVVDDVRRISSFLHMTAAEGGFRVVVIDPGDEMNRNAANALLKSLEEPPVNTVIIVVSHMPGRFLPTIRSRCRGLRLLPLREADFTKIMARVMAWGQSQMDPAVIAELFRLSEGSPGKALRLAEEGGLELYHELLTLLSSLLPGEAGRSAGADTAALHTLADRVAGKQGEAAYRTLADFLNLWICRLIRLGAGQTGDGAGELPMMQRFLAAASLDQWLNVWDNQQALFAQTDRLNLDRRQAILNAFFSLEKTVRA